MYALENSIQHYAWGSKNRLSDLLGKAPSGQPEAELWVGAHAKAPSRLEDGRSLLELIDGEPERCLGERNVQAFGPRLPYLLKILAVEAPLSLQAHPNREQARAGFLREEEAGVPIGARHRTYKDDNHKPELLCALTPFEALCGFRPAAESAELFERLALEDESWAVALRRGNGLKGVFRRLMELPPGVKRTTVEGVLRACGRQSKDPTGPFAASIQWALRLGEAYPGDVGVVASLLLNHVALEPGQAIYLGSGQLHAYLSGVGVELMANSDNVVRGGLTPKFVDVEQLQQILHFEGSGAHPVKARLCDRVVRYPTPAREFELSRAELEGEPVTVSGAGPRLCLCTRGRVALAAAPAGALGAPPRQSAKLELRAGQACFVPADAEPLTATGPGQLFIASVGALNAPP